MLEVKLLSPTAIMPTRGSEQAAGLDLYADEKGKVGAGHTTQFSTGVAVKIPEGFVGLVKPRSGFAFSFGVDSMAGVIDSDYRGEIKVLLTSHGSTCGIAKHERIAQLLILPVMMLTPILVDELDATERGENGLGSTGR
ncbi:dUTP diphosphatase [bacterium]|nr:dUTP diphosphatase [bacterium]